MRVLMFGDVYGRIGRNGIKKELPKLKEKYNPDFTIVNIENITSGRGPIEKHVKEIENLGVDVMTGGDHIFDNKAKIVDYLDKKDSPLIRVANYYESEGNYIPGKGYKIVERDGKRLAVIHLMGTVFMSYNVFNPFIKITEILEEIKDENLNGIILDFHKEATSEIYGMAYYLDGKVSFVGGTHTHVQTNDDLILKKGTGIIGDIGMNGPLYGVIGAEFESVKNRFLTGINKGKIEQSLDPHYVICGVCIDIDDTTGLCENIEKIRITGKL